MPSRTPPPRPIWDHPAGPARARPIFLAICLAAWAAMCSGCLLTPLQTQSAAQAPAPQVPEGASSPEVAAQIQSSAQQTDFQAKATDRQSFQVHIDFGRVFESQGNFDAALLEYQEALAVVETKRRGSLGPADSALAHRRMAGTLDRLGRFAQAEAHYQKALNFSPRDSKIWNDVGYSYYLQGRWPDAERALKTAAQLAPDDERIRINLGLALAAAGKTTEAFPLLSQSTGDAAGHANLGYLLAATGQFDLARQQYEIALAQRPDMELARRALARLARQQQNSAAPDGTGGSLAASKRVAAEALDRHVERAHVTTATVPPARNLSVKPAAVTTATISPPQNLPVEPAAATKATIPPSRNLHIEPTAVFTATIPPSRNLQVKPAAAANAAILPSRDLLVEPPAATKATIPPSRNLHVEPTVVITANIPPSRKLQVKPAAAASAAIPPSRDLLVEPAAATKATIPPPRNLHVEPTVVITSKIPPPRNLQVKPAVATKATILPPRNLQVEPTAASKATIPPPRNLQVEPAAATKATIPPPRNWSLADGARAPRELIKPAGAQPAKSKLNDLSKLPPPPSQ